MSSEDWRKILINFDYYHYKYKKKMECQEIIKFLGNDDKQPSKLKTKTWIEVTNESRERCNPSGEINFKITMQRTSFCEYGDVYMLVKETIIINEAGADAASKEIDKKNNKVTFKGCAPFRAFVSKTSNIELDNANDLVRWCDADV